jgi:hypothetical protein
MTGSRDEKGHLLPGHKLGGRPLGTSQIARLRALIEPERDAIVAKLIETAKAGDGNSAVRAAEVLLDRLAAKPRPTAELVRIDGLAQAQTLLAKADAVILAVARGEVSADAGRAVLAMLDTYARAIKTDDLEARIKVLEGQGPQHARLIEPAPVQDAELL